MVRVPLKSTKTTAGLSPEPWTIFVICNSKLPLLLKEDWMQMHLCLKQYHLPPRNKNRWPVNLRLHHHPNLQDPLPHPPLERASGNPLRSSSSEVPRRSCSSNPKPVPFPPLLHLTPAPPHLRPRGGNHQHRVSRRTGHQTDATAAATVWALGINARCEAAPARSAVRIRTVKCARSLNPWQRLHHPKEVSKSIIQSSKCCLPPVMGADGGKA